MACGMHILAAAAINAGTLKCDGVAGSSSAPGNHECCVSGLPSSSTPSDTCARAGRTAMGMLCRRLRFETLHASHVIQAAEGRW